MKNRYSQMGISDTLFKILFGNKEDKTLLCEYVKAICGLELDQDLVQFEPIEIKDNVDERGIRLDIRCREIRGKRHTEINLEAQTTMPSLNSFNNRKIHYACSLYKDSFKEGDSFDKEVYSRTIFFMLYDKDLKRSPIKKTILYDVRNQVEYSQIEIYEIYIKNLLEYDIAELEEYDKMVLELTEVLVTPNWRDYEKSPNETVRKVVDRMSRLTKEEGERISAELSRQFHQEMRELDEEIRREAREKALAEGHAEGLAEGKAKGIAEGRAEGLAEGKAENQREVANNLKNMGFEISLISQALNLTTQEVNELLKQ